MRENDNLISKIKDLKEVSLELKTAQATGGDSWVVYKVASSNTYDIDVTLGPNTTSRWLVTFIPDTDRLAVAALSYINSSSGAGSWTRGVTQKYQTNNQWYLAISTDVANINAINFKEKFVITSTSQGTIVVTSV